ncbi:MAG: CRISPR-associated endoribonuclease Cas6 [Faecousia sp.]
MRIFVTFHARELRLPLACNDTDAPFELSLATAGNTDFRRLVTAFKHTCITACYGGFLLQGAPQVPDFLYHTGLGTRNSQGFGMFDLLS